MSLLEQQNFLARIFTDENLRHSFWENPEKTGQENFLNETEINRFKEIIAADLNFFADSLVHKRLHEVEKLLPLTKKALGENFPKLFKEFSNTFQPITVKKHLEDAIEFCKFLKTVEIELNFVKELAKFEQTKHEFFSNNKTFSFCLLRHNLFTFKKKIGLAIWFRIGNQTHNFIW